jgi:lipopolysaccharide export system protein LptC
MNLSATRLFPLVLMLALALLTFWLERTVREDPAPAAQRSHHPDYVVERFTITDFNRAGLAESALSATRMEHFPDDDSTDLQAPRVMQAKPGQPRLALSADRGTLSQDGEELFLYDNVLVLREAAAGLPEARMQTSFLHVVRARALVRTDREVRLSEGGRAIIGRGMEYDNESRQLSLHAEVRGSFEAKQP